MKANIVITVICCVLAFFALYLYSTSRHGDAEDVNQESKAPEAQVVAVAAEKEVDPEAEKKAKDLERLKERLAKPRPKQDDPLGDFLAAYNNFPKSTKIAEFQEIVKYEANLRRMDVIGEIARFLDENPGQPLPNVGRYNIDPLYVVEGLWFSGKMERELLLKILEVETTDNLEDLRSKAWEDHRGARLYWSLIASRFGLTIGELKRLGLNGLEIANIIPQHPRELKRLGLDDVEIALILHRFTREALEGTGMTDEEIHRVKR